MLFYNLMRCYVCGGARVGRIILLTRRIKLVV